MIDLQLTSRIVTTKSQGAGASRGLGSTLAVAGFALALVLSLAGSASAVEFSVLGVDTILLDELEVAEIEIVMTNYSLTEVAGIGASVWGWDRENVQFLGGEAVDSFFDTICVGPGTCFGGHTNLAGGNLVESEIGNSGPRVQIALAAGLTPISNPGGGIDQGLDQQVGTAMFRLRFAVLRPSATTLLIDTTYPGDGVIIPGGSDAGSTGTTVTLIVVPEPGTAVLLGLGLAGLASRRRFESIRF